MTRFLQYLTIELCHFLDKNDNSSLRSISRRIACDTSSLAPISSLKPGLDHQTSESPSSNLLEHLTKTLETSHFRQGFPPVSPASRHLACISFWTLGDRFSLSESNDSSRCGEKVGQEGSYVPRVSGDDASIRLTEAAGSSESKAEHVRRAPRQGPRHTALGDIRSWRRGENEGKRYNLHP